MSGYLALAYTWYLYSHSSATAYRANKKNPQKIHSRVLRHIHPYHTPLHNQQFINQQPHIIHRLKNYPWQVGLHSIPTFLQQQTEGETPVQSTNQPANPVCPGINRQPEPDRHIEGLAVGFMDWARWDWNMSSVSTFSKGDNTMVLKYLTRVERRLLIWTREVNTSRVSVHSTFHSHSIPYTSAGQS